MGWIGTVAAIGMAIGPPLIYVDQARQILKTEDSSGFSHDVCAVVILANITRCFFFLGHPFETALIIQSLLLITAQLFLLALCVYYKPKDETSSSSNPRDQPGKAFVQAVRRRPFNFWKWDSLAVYMEFLAGFIVVMGVIYAGLKGFDVYIEALGGIALGLEATLPIPQIIANFRRRSTAGFSDFVLAGWLGGDIFKTGFYITRDSPAQFTVCGAATVLLDLVVLAQRIIYRNHQPISTAAPITESYGDGDGDHREEENDTELSPVDQSGKYARV